MNVPLSQTFRLRIAHGHADAVAGWCQHTHTMESAPKGKASKPASAVRSRCPTAGPWHVARRPYRTTHIDDRFAGHLVGLRCCYAPPLSRLASHQLPGGAGYRASDRAHALGT